MDASEPETELHQVIEVGADGVFVTVEIDQGELYANDGVWMA